MEKCALDIWVTIFLAISKTLIIQVVHMNNQNQSRDLEELLEKTRQWLSS